MNTEETKAPAEETTQASAAPQQRGGRGPRRDGNRPGRGPRREGGRRNETPVEEGPQLMEKVVYVNRCAKVVKGGRRFSFSALIVVGDQKGKVGYGFGKANEVSDAIRKGTDAAKRAMKKVVVVNDTIPHESYSEFGGAKIVLKPAASGAAVSATDAAITIFVRSKPFIGATESDAFVPYDTDIKRPARLLSPDANALARVRAFSTATDKHFSVIGFNTSGLVYIRKFSEYTFGLFANCDRICSISVILFAETSTAIVVSIPSVTDFCSSRFHSVFSYELN